MDMSIALICYIVAAILFLVASYPPVSKGWALPLGLFFFVLGHVLAGVAFKSV